MKTIYLLVAFFIGAASNPVWAACTPPDNANTTWCQSCGNLEQNMSRGHDLAWNEFLRNERMQLELRVFGSTTVYLIEPPHSSPGVLYYTVAIEDPQFVVTNTQSHAEAVTLMQEYAIGFDYDGANAHAEFIWRRHIAQRIEQITSSSVSTGSGPYILRMFDSRGNPVAGGTVDWPRTTPEQELALAGPDDLQPDDRYGNDACEPEDTRYGSPGSGDSSSGSDRPDDTRDEMDEYWWEWEEAWGGRVPLCVDDFTDPAGSGVICFI